MKANVLVTAVGGIVGQGLLKCLNYSNKDGNSPVKYTIIGADMSPTAAGIYRSNAGIIVPSARSAAEDEYLNAIISLCKHREIEAIFVGSDAELVVLAKSRQRVESESGAKLLIAPLDVISIARDKWKTYEFCKANQIPYVESCLPDDKDGFVREHRFPLVVKPREGYGSVHYYLVNNREQVERAISVIQAEGWHPLIQRYIEGTNSGPYQVIEGSWEFTTGVTVDTKGEKVMSSVSINKVLKGGQTYKALVDDFPIVRKSAESTALRLKATGSINIQAKLEGDSPMIFEINPRFSATCPIRAVAGVNEPDIIFRNTLNNEDLAIGTYRKLVCMRYLNEVYAPYSIYEEIESIGELDRQAKSEAGKESSFIVDYF
jgi:carbamoyl-phosphate synthase large subunit